MSERVRAATGDDVGALIRLRRGWAAEKGAPTDEPGFGERFAAWLAAEGERRRFWLAEVDGAAVGMVNLTTFTRMPYPTGTDVKGAWGYVGNLFVDPVHRGCGIGRELIEACTAYAREQDFARVVLAPSERSVPLYERAGLRSATELMILPLDG
ncbi:MAG: GNAT family N-acetyltransferase [Nocardioides sp.]|uniref:GNAT family N-acetyltransferase n=1 Tax=Nocardioides sp. TaxID=35761 RepID=UPI0039E278B7